MLHRIFDATALPSNSLVAPHPPSLKRSGMERFRKLQSIVIVKDTWLGFRIELNLSHFFYQLSAATRMVRELMVDKYIVIVF